MLLSFFVFCFFANTPPTLHPPSTPMPWSSYTTSCTKARRLWTSALAVGSCRFASHEWWATHVTGKHIRLSLAAFWFITPIHTLMCQPINENQSDWMLFHVVKVLYELTPPPFFLLQMGPKGKVIGIDHIKELVDDSINNVKKDDPSLITSGRIKLVGKKDSSATFCIQPNRQFNVPQWGQTQQLSKQQAALNNGAVRTFTSAGGFTSSPPKPLCLFIFLFCLYKSNFRRLSRGFY